MRLLVDCHVFDGKFQGTRTYLQGIYTNLISCSYDLELYFAACDIEKLRNIFGEADNVNYVPLHTNSSLKRLIWEFPRIIKKYRIDYAHFQYISPLKKCCKEIVTIHDLLFLDYPEFFPLLYRLKNKLFFKRSAKRADVLLTVSEYSKNEIIKHFGIDAAYINITPNGILLPKKNNGIPDIKSKYGLDKYILTVSRIEPRKNHQLLLQAFVEMKLYENGYKLVIVGAEDLKNDVFYHYYNSLSVNIKSKILIIQVPFLDLVSLYKNAALFVFPSFAEGFGIPPIEAIALGCTTLCSNTTAMADFDFLGNKLFDPYNLEELKEKINYWLKHSNMNLGKEQEAVKKRYNWKRIADVFYSTFHID